MTMGPICLWRGLWRVLCVWLWACVLQGCVATGVMVPPKVDQVRFSPMKKEQRTIEEPRVKFLPREDGYEYCARITGIPVTPTAKPMACAFWNVRRKECTIVTPLSTGFNYLGHELRHCFEGAFHD